MQKLAHNLDILLHSPSKLYNVDIERGMSDDVDIYIAQILPLSPLCIFIAVGLVVKRIRHFLYIFLGKKFPCRVRKAERDENEKKENTIRLLLSIYRMACMNREQVRDDVKEDEDFPRR